MYKQFNNRSFIPRALNKISRILANTLTYSYITYKSGFSLGLLIYKSLIYLERDQWRSYKVTLIKIFSILKKRNNPDISFFLDAFETNPSNSFNYQILKNKLTKPLIHDIPTIYLLCILNYCRLYGDFRLAYLLRDVLINRTINYQKKLSIFSLKEFFQISLETGDYKFLEHKVNNLIFASNFLSEDGYAFLNFLNHQNCNANEIWGKIFDKDDLLYKKFLENKSVAIVGPTFTGELLGAEIDSFDVVIRSNFRINSNEPTEVYGKKTDVTYFNHYRISSQLPDVISATKKTKWVVLKGKNDLNTFRKFKTSSHDCNERFSFLPHDYFFINSEPMGIQIIINDVLRFSPKRIKLFSTSFYISETNYNPNYKISSTEDNSQAASDIRAHEPFGNFSFVRNLYINGLIEADETSSRVLNMDNFEYASKLQNLYGHYEVN